MKLVRLKLLLEFAFHLNDAGTGDDETAEHEGDSTGNQAKGKRGRKPGQTNKNASKKENDQQPESEQGIEGGTFDQL